MPRASDATACGLLLCCPSARPSELEQLRRAEDVRRVAEPRGAPAPARGERHLRRPVLCRSVERVGDRLECCVAARASSPRSGRASASASSSMPGAAPCRSPGAPRSVSVPVLSRQITSTDASDSTAFSCWASAPRRAIRSAATAYVRLVRRISPSGTSVTTAATAIGTASEHAASCRCRARSRGRSPAEPSRRRGRAAAGSASARAASEGAGTCGRSSARRARVALLAHGRHGVEAGSLDRERARADILADPALDRARLAGQDRLVNSQAVAAGSSAPSATSWSPASIRIEITGYHALDLDLPRPAVPNHRGVRCDEGREAIEGVLRTPLLEDPDSRVRDEDRDEQRVLPVPERERRGHLPRRGSG